MKIPGWSGQKSCEQHCCIALLYGIPTGKLSIKFIKNTTSVLNTEMAHIKVIDPVLWALQTLKLRDDSLCD